MNTSLGWGALRPGELSGISKLTRHGDILAQSGMRSKKRDESYTKLSFGKFEELERPVEQKKELFRCKGRFRNSEMPTERNILRFCQSDHDVTKLVVMDCHRGVLHGGVNDTLAEDGSCSCRGRQRGGPGWQRAGKNAREAESGWAVGGQSQATGRRNLRTGKQGAVERGGQKGGPKRLGQKNPAWIRERSHTRGKQRTDPTAQEEEHSAKRTQGQRGSREIGAVPDWENKRRRTRKGRSGPEVREERGVRGEKSTSHEAQGEEEKGPSGGEEEHRQGGTREGEAKQGKGGKLTPDRHGGHANGRQKEGTGGLTGRNDKATGENKESGTGRGRGNRRPVDPDEDSTPGTQRRGGKGDGERRQRRRGSPSGSKGGGVGEGVTEEKKGGERAGRGTDGRTAREEDGRSSRRKYDEGRARQKRGRRGDGRRGERERGEKATGRGGRTAQRGAPPGAKGNRTDHATQGTRTTPSARGAGPEGRRARERRREREVKGGEERRGTRVAREQGEKSTAGGEGAGAMKKGTGRERAPRATWQTGQGRRVRGTRKPQEERAKGTGEGAKREPRGMREADGGGGGGAEGTGENGRANGGGRGEQASTQGPGGAGEGGRRGSRRGREAKGGNALGGNRKTGRRTDTGGNKSWGERGNKGEERR
eukprot:gene5500-1938_t